jgi:NTE family protein
MGSLIGALYAAGMKAKILEEIALNMNWKEMAILFTPTISLAGLVDGKRIETLIKSFIGEKKFSQLKIPLATVATDIETGEEVIITQGSVLKAII